MSLVKSTPISPIKSDFRSRFENEFKRGQRAFLLDYSGSMEYVESKGRTRLQHLISIMDKFPNERKFIFSGDCKEVHSLPTTAIGSTDLAEGFEEVKRCGISHVVLITDGEPDDEESAEQAAKGLKIDAFFVGSQDNVRAKEFLRRLCDNSGGSFDSTNISNVQQIESGIRGLLA